MAVRAVAPYGGKAIIGIHLIQLSLSNATNSIDVYLKYQYVDLLSAGLYGFKCNKFSMWGRDMSLTKILALFSVLFSLMHPSVASAGGSQLGAISDILIQRDGRMFFSISGLRYGQPACATIVGRWVINLATPGGAAIAALIMSSQAQGKRVAVAGTNNCEDWSDTESVYYLHLEK